jgi:hypothetical protein
MSCMIRTQPAASLHALRIWHHSLCRRSLRSRALALLGDTLRSLKRNLDINAVHGRVAEPRTQSRPVAIYRQIMVLFSCATLVGDWGAATLMESCYSPQSKLKVNLGKLLILACFIMCSLWMGIMQQFSLHSLCSRRSTGTSKSASGTPSAPCQYQGFRSGWIGMKVMVIGRGMSTCSGRSMQCHLWTIFFWSHVQRYVYGSSSALAICHLPLPREYLWLFYRVMICHSQIVRA